MSVALSLLEAFPALPRTALAADHGGVRADVISDQLVRVPHGLRLRSLSLGDADALVRTVDRCSAKTRQDRFHEPLTSLPSSWARRICVPDGRRVVIAAAVEGIDHRQANQPGAILGAPYDDEIVALAQVEPEAGSAELVILVEDSYQRAGLGVLLVCAALSEAARNGLTRVRAHIMPENEGIQRLLSVLELPTRRGHDDGKECWTLDISGLGRVS
jgi:GNAT superfamily N-acetyltransferase